MPEVRVPGADSAVSSGAAGELRLDLPVDIDDLPDGLLVLDREGRLLVSNTVARGLLALSDSPPALLGRPIGELVTLLDERGNDWWECSRPLLALPGVQRQPERRLTLVAAQGERELLVTTRYRRVAGEVDTILVSLRDTRSRERLDRTRADLISTVAHELRSPLTSVKGFTATLIAKWTRFTEEQKQLMLQTVNTDADRVTRLLTELLDVSRIDAGRLELRRQVVDLPAAVRRVVAGRVAAGEPEERFDIQVHGELPEMWVDPDKLDQVLHNLVENALRHGGGTVSVQVAPSDAADEPGVEVVVRDQGEGIPDAELPRVFSKFARGGARRGGTGLGLYIAKGVVEAHGGTIVAARGPDGGAEFRFTLPAGTPSFA